MSKVLLIVPCYNEEKRLDLATFRAAPEHLSFLFANDGSSDGTRLVLDQLTQEAAKFRAYHAPQNMGKGDVIQAAYQDWQKRAPSEQFDWIGYWDADLATPLSAVDDMLKYRSAFYASEDVAAIWGSRISRLGSDIRRHAHRHYLGRIFVTVVSVLLGVKAYDSQCGAKLFRPEAARVAFGENFVSRWIFDVEILLRLGSAKIVEFPLLKWTDVPGSKIKIFREMFRVWRDIFRIRSKY